MVSTGKFRYRLLVFFIIFYCAIYALPDKHSKAKQPGQEGQGMYSAELNGESHQLGTHRSKRCIVVQKQSHSPQRPNPYGTDYDDEEDDSDSSFENYRKEIKRPRKMNRNSGRGRYNTKRRKAEKEGPEMP